jgi:phosphoglycolate phosphatase-like HAD superfamily hydrolase
MKDTHVIFDLDDTLVDIWSDFFIPLAIETYKELGYKTKKEQFLKARSYRIASKRMENLDTTKFWRTYDKYDTVAARDAAINEGRIRLFEDTVSSLERLVYNANLYVVSNTPKDKAEYQIKRFGLDRYFKGISCNDHVKPNKPDPCRAWELLNGVYHPGQALWFVGDSPEDVATGKAMSAKTIFLDWRSFTAIRPDYIAKSLTGAVDIISRESNVHLL